MIARIPSGYSEALSFEIPEFSLSSGPSCAHKISKLSIFPSYGLRCYTAPVCSLLMDRSENPQPSHLGKQCDSFQSEFRRCAAWPTDDPAGMLKCFHNQTAIGVFQGHRRLESSGAMQTGGHELCLLFVKRVWEHAVPRKDNRAFHQILQLADVARPGIPLKGSHGFRRNVVDLLPHAAAKHLHEMRDKSRNVL